MTEPFALDIAAPQRRFTDREKFEAYVLWLIGFSASNIASVVGLTRKQVLNLINRSEYANRAGMSDDQRKEFLGELRAIRCEDGQPIDGGRLNRLDWTIRPLTDARKRRPARRAA